MPTLSVYKGNFNQVKADPSAEDRTAEVGRTSGDHLVHPTPAQAGWAKASCQGHVPQTPGISHCREPC